MVRGYKDDFVVGARIADHYGFLAKVADIEWVVQQAIHDHALDRGKIIDTQCKPPFAHFAVQPLQRSIVVQHFALGIDNLPGRVLEQAFDVGQR